MKEKKKKKDTEFWQKIKSDKKKYIVETSVSHPPAFTRGQCFAVRIS